MTFSLADAEKLLGALATLDEIKESQLRIEIDMATFKETVIAAFAYAKARINELEILNEQLASDDEADAEAIVAAAAEAAEAKAALEAYIAEDTAEDTEILEAAAAFLPMEEEPVEEEPVVEEPVVEEQGL
jgi:hypothetical protein